MNNNQQSWLALSCIQLSGALSLPVLMIGYYLGQHYALNEISYQILVGNFILFCLSVFYTTLINQKKWVTIEFAQHLFGSKGSLISATGMVISLLGWSALQINLMYTVVGHPYLASMVIVFLLYFLTSRDLAYLVQANKILLPLIATCLFYLLVTTPQNKAAPLIIDSQAFKIGLMMVITAGSGLVFDLPTFYRHAATAKDALVSLALVFLVSLPLIEGLGYYLSRYYAPLSNSSSWIQGFTDSFNLPSLCFLLLSGLLGTCLNLYSASIIVNRSLGLSYKKALFFFACLAAIVANVQLEQQFVSFLEVINLNAEIIALLILLYASIKGVKLPQPTVNQTKIHQAILGLILSYALCTKLFNISLFEDLFLDTAFLGCFSMLSYYLPKQRMVNTNENT